MKNLAPLLHKGGLRDGGMFNSQHSLAPRYEGGGRRPGGVYFLKNETPPVKTYGFASPLKEGAESIHCIEEKAPAGAGAFYLTYSGTCGWQQRPSCRRP